MDFVNLYNKADYKDENGMMFNCDVLDLLPIIEDESVDLIVTDPPYKITSCIACKQLNRKYIGCELDSKYFNICKERIK